MRLKKCLTGALVAAATLTAGPAALAADARFALSMMHFNVQYVAGGLWGYLLSDPAHPMDDREVEDRIVTESFDPVLDLYAAHPGWGADIELQGYMLEVLDERHPAVLDKLRALAVSGQIEVVSFHYSDQLFLAYPRGDWERSATLNRATFDRLGVPLGRAVFCQEGQASVAMAGAMAAHDYDVLVWPRNLFSFQHEGAAQAPLYRFGEGFMLTYSGQDAIVGDTHLKTTWTFVDDGELLAVEGKLNPYLGDGFVYSPAAVAKYEGELQALEAEGYSITTVSKYVAAISSLVPAEDPPPLLDGTWQPGSTDGTFRWLGGRGLFFKEERDADARSSCALAHRELLAAETIAAKAGLDVSEELAGAARLMLLGEVSDSTGVNPFRGEVEYTLAHEAEVLRIARDVIARAKAALGADSVAIDTASGEVLVAPPPPDLGAPDEPPLGPGAPLFPEISSGDRPAAIASRSLAPGHRVLTITFPPGNTREIEVKFPGEMGDVVYTPGLADAPVHAPRAAFSFEHFDLALSDGLIGLGPARFIVKDQAMAHVAARITPGSGDVVFHDQTSPIGEEATWVFHLVEGDEAAALAVARQVNVSPRLWR
jgi:hypothetical protein